MYVQIIGALLGRDFFKVLLSEPGGYESMIVSCFFLLYDLQTVDLGYRAPETINTRHNIT